jgi:acetyl-CoA carboxylase carboxyltransferase component
MEKKRIGMDPWAWIEHTLDKSSFEEYGSDKNKSGYGDEIISGIGKCAGKVICLYAHNPKVGQGFVTSKGAQKICSIMQKAFELGVPMVSFMASPGVSVEEGIASGDSYTRVISENIRLSSVVPQIAVVMGTTMGAPAYSTTLMDFVIFNKARSALMVTGPSVISEVMGEKTTIKSLGGAQVHSSKTGIADFVVKNIPEQIEKLKQLLSYLPSNNIEDTPKRLAVLPSESSMPIIPKDLKHPFDMNEMIKAVVDGNSFLEIKEEFAPSILTGFSFIGGQVVGILANQGMVMSGAIDYLAARKASRFLKLCDSYNMTILNLIDVPGFIPGEEQEHNGLLRYGAQLCQAMHTSTPRFSLVVRRCYGAAAYIMMQTRAQGGDMVMALSESRIAIMGYEGARKMVYPDMLESEDMSLDYYKNYEDPKLAYKAGMVDQIIEISEVRDKLVGLVETYERKRMPERPFKKHLTTP